MELQLYNRQRSLKMCDKWLKEGQKWMEMAWCLFCNIIAIDGGGWCVCVSLSPWCGATARPGPAPSRALLKTKILKTTGLFSCKQLSDVIFTDKNNFPEIIAENTELMVQNKIGEVACLYGSLSTVECCAAQCSPNVPTNHKCHDAPNKIKHRWQTAMTMFAIYNHRWRLVSVIQCHQIAAATDLINTLWR